MATNLVSLVMQFLTPDMIARIASALGLNASVAQKAIGGAVPTLLAGLADVTSTPQGARQLSALAQQQPASVESFKSLIGGSGQGGLAESGASMLSGLFGGGTLDTIAQSIGKFAGLDAASTKSLLGMLGPVILGALGQHQRTTGMDSSGLASLLGTQRDQIAASIPSSLSDQLSASGLIDRAARTTRSATEQVSTAARSVPGVSTNPASSQLPYWLAGVAILGALAWYAFGRQPAETVADLPRPAATQPGTVGMAQPDLTIGGVNLTNQVNSSLGTLKSVLPTMTDPASAQAAVPKLREATTQLNDVSSLATKLSPEGKSALARMIASATPTINQMFDKVLATPGVGDIAKPTIDELRGRLDTLSRA